MLDTETKHRIDTARDILVGKVPDPKSQVEQITIALIYKFMDDMDAEAEELGGKRKFFSGVFGRYGWKKLMAPDLGGFDVLTLYAEAIQKMNVNPNIPQLFRDIFKNAYLPYRDPETLKSFLKIIDDFEYSHSEKLGDAFEYLLSVLGSQGDAGQFRTPRHIIDFMVELVDPKKNETILDPACGTAGFLISSYKHIVKNNSSSYNSDIENTNGNGDKYKGDKLTPDERKKLAVNIKGYDISPDMVRLSLVNLYLHGFANPLIFEYDTLTSDEKWNEYADVIFANPPFMSPKGGIRPHKRFSVESSRSEVLFVDYIAEHLTPSGRGAVIVPEGIIFQSGTAYRSLRKMMVEKYLYAVVSLPAGVFNPYSGVKTSIFLMDKTLSRRTDKILFAKIENDGFDLGAQRRANDKSELPYIVNSIKNYIKSIIDSKEFTAEDYKNIVVASKEKIEEDGECNLGGERYKINDEVRSNFTLIKIDDAVDNIVYTNKIKTRDFLQNGKYPIIDQSENFIAGFWNDKADLFKIVKPVIIFGDHTRIIKYIDFDFVLGADGVKILQPIDSFNSKFFYYLLRSVYVKSLGYSRHYKELKDKQIPLPPLEAQKEIVAEIEVWQKIIDGARQVVQNYKPQIKIDPNWPMIELENACIKITDGSHYSPTTVDNGYPYITVKDIVDDKIDFNNCKYINQSAFDELAKNNCRPRQNDVLFSKDGTVGKVALVNFDKDFVVLSSLAIVTPDLTKISPAFMKYIFQSDYFLNKAIEQKTGVAIRRIVLKTLKTILIPLPSIDIQDKVVSELELEENLINSNNDLVKLFEQKIKDKIASVWGE